MASSLRMSVPKMASMAAQSTTKVARPAQFQKFTRAYSVATRNTATFNTMKRTSTMLQAARTKVSPIGAQAKRAYSSEMANALVQVSQNLGMGSAAIGLGGAGIGIGLVFAALLQAVARNPSLRGQLFSYAILGFAFVEAIGLFDLMVAMMCKYV
ncbi:Putative ATP synthase, F0 complex, subunit C, V-ATPase proteolipid subunit C-like protein [Septoria linicola]|uniref:ATP synthase subunit 9, mitochondrial n=1 Tax=Septoria linicola TaxID=215465 RepID=A0A9Q9AQ79_9PEZI|nr:putative ATP synthase, F0 complex, subunit C, V-ATPase proteolipid subunit C-like protein [Septoria linicola]USW52479.1 Putative ATP synthase, F0 complex, subunit C, V-ATPase proteolipid subunit C-like protein [Septoria linicola]